MLRWFSNEVGPEPDPEQKLRGKSVHGGTDPSPSPVSLSRTDFAPVRLLLHAIPGSTHSWAAAVTSLAAGEELHR